MNASVTINNCIFCLLDNILYKFDFLAAGKVIGGIITVKSSKILMPIFRKYSLNYSKSIWGTLDPDKSL